MGSSHTKNEAAHFDVEKIGGIDSTKVSIPPGVTVLTGENATNRTSFLQSIISALGSRQATLKGDADEGRVEMELGGQEYQRTLQRSGSSVHFRGEGYLDEPEVANLFAFLLENNEARQSVSRGEDLRELIMRPVDTEQIRRDIEELETKKDELDEKIADIERDREKLSELEAQKSELSDEISAQRDTLTEKEQEIDAKSRDLEESKQEKEALQSKLDELQEVRSELASVRSQIENHKDSLSSSKRERAELNDELDEMATAPMGEYNDLEEQIQNLREQRKRLSSDVSDLQNLIQYNEDRLEQGSARLLQSDGADDSAASSRLLDGGPDIVCWTCGSEVQRSQIEKTIERLQDVRSQKMDELNEVKSRLTSLKSEQSEKERVQDRRDELESRIDSLQSEIERRETEVTSLNDRRAELTKEVERLEEAVEEMESGDFEAVLSLHREANQLEFEIGRLESDKEDIEQRIEDIEQSITELKPLKRQREEVANELTDLRTKIDQFETDAVESFNEHMKAILDILDYDNIDRIWIERREQTMQEGRQKVDRTRFELHIVRTTDNGTVYEDTIDHLSESEREVTGLIFALAGYLVHDLHEEVPFMLLDSLEAIDSARIAALVDYFSEYVEYLIVALLEEDATALDSEYNRVREI